MPRLPKEGGPFKPKRHLLTLPMKTTHALLVALAFGLAACDVKVSNPPGDTTIVNPPSEKKVENNTTVVNPPKTESTKQSTSTTVTGGGAVTEKSTTTETK